MSRNTVLTILVRVIIAAISFGLVIFTSNVWGDAGRGLIALVIADVSIIIILNNIFSGSTLAFHAPKTSKNIIFSIAFIGTLLSSFLSAIIFATMQGSGYFLYLFTIPLFMSFATSISLYYLGKNNIKNYNISYLIPYVLIIISLFILYYFLGVTQVDAYFISYFFAYGAFSIIGYIVLFNKSNFRFEFKKESTKQILSYGFKNEISYFIQFLNYRLSFFFIASWLGLSELGLFSVSVAIAESVWIISKSIATIHYSKIINTESPSEKIKLTEKAVANSLVLTILALIVVSLVPNSFFTLIFGPDFSNVKELTIYLFPGIIAIAVSNIYGHYFSGIGQMRILIIKSSLGFIATIVLISFLLKEYGLQGACIALNFAYITSSVYLYIMFKAEKRKIKLLRVRL